MGPKLAMAVGEKSSHPLNVGLQCARIQKQGRRVNRSERGQNRGFFSHGERLYQRPAPLQAFAFGWKSNAVERQKIVTSLFMGEVVCCWGWLGNEKGIGLAHNVFCLNITSPCSFTRVRVEWKDPRESRYGPAICCCLDLIPTRSISQRTATRAPASRTSAKPQTETSSSSCDR